MVTHLSRPVADNFPDEWIDKVCEADSLPDNFDLEDDESIPTGLTLTPKEIEAACAELGCWQSAETFNRTERPLRLAAAAMALSSVSVVGNALRLRLTRL